MEKNKKMLLGVGLVALVGYVLWSTSKSKTVSFVNATGKSGEPCSFNMNGEIVKGKVSELDTKYCFSSDGRRGLMN
jgi:hypothetical protein